MIIPMQIALVRTAVGREVVWLHCGGSMVSGRGDEPDIYDLWCQVFVLISISMRLHTCFTLKHNLPSFRSLRNALYR